ncbi:MAG: hypothetical protein IJ512_05530 [Ruminococcus sp.]|nr:hypothetical protein [Ruminococcus sp.]
MNRLNIRIWMTAAQRRTLALFCCMLLLTAGCAAGTICMEKNALEPLCQFCLRYGVPCPDSRTNSIFLSAMGWNGSMLLAGLCLGFCAVGQPFLCALLALQGFAVGCLLTRIAEAGFSQQMLLQFSLGAVYGIAASFLLLLGMREAMRMSCIYLKTCTQDCEAAAMRRRLRLYGIRFGAILLLLLAASGIYALLYHILF